MCTRPFGPQKIGGERQISDPRFPGLGKRSEILKNRKRQKEREIYRENPQCPTYVELAQTDTTGPVIFENHQPGDQKTADDEEKADPEVSVKDPPECCDECRGKARRENAVCAKHHCDANRPPSVEGWHPGGVVLHLVGQ